MDLPQGLRIALRYARAFREANIPYMMVGACVLHVQQGKLDLAKLRERAAFDRVEGKLDQAVAEAEKVERA